MTEREWLECREPLDMLPHLNGKASLRKARLLLTALCRRHEKTLMEAQRKAIDVAERFADGEMDSWRLEAAREMLKEAYQEVRAPSYYVRCLVDLTISDAAQEWLLSGASAGLVAAYWSGPPGYTAASINARYAAREAERAFLLAMVRCLFGNPFRRVSIPSWVLGSGDSTVSRLARSFYEDRAFDQLPVLADALEDAGCTDPEVLGHLRSPEPHSRGCHVVDLVLGKE